MKSLKSIGRRGFLHSTAGVAAGLACCRVPEQAGAEAAPKAREWKLPEESRARQDFEADVRSRKVLYVPHCALNQNARIVRAADFPAMFEPLLAALRENNIGVVQLPCPELRVLGLGRRSVRPGLESAEGREHLGLIIDDLIYEIRQYQLQGFRVVGILGKEGSPACGVTTTWWEGPDKEGPGEGEGVFLRLIRERLEQEKLDIPICGMADHEQERAIQWVLERA